MMAGVKSKAAVKETATKSKVSKEKSSKTKSPPKSPSPKRKSSPARPKSPSRRSPARKMSPARKTSPARNTTSPTRKRSPGRPRTKSHSEEKDAKIKQIIIESDTESDAEFEKKVKEKPKAAVKGRTRIDRDYDFKESNYTAKRMTRSSANREIDRVVHLKHFEQYPKKMGEFSDEDEIKEKLPEGKKDTEFGGNIGALFWIVATPVSIIALHALCNEYQCSFLHRPSLAQFKSISTWLDSMSLLGYLSYTILLAVLSSLPVGGKKVHGLPDKQGRFLYVMNGFFSFIIILAILIGCELRGIRLADYVVKHLFHLLTSALIVGFALAIFVHVHSHYVSISALNTHSVGKGRIYEFFMGRELHPRIGGVVDLKMYVLRLSVIGAILLNFIYLYNNIGFSLPKDIQLNNILTSFKTLNVTLLTYSTINTIYLLWALLCEDGWVTTFEVVQEGFGYMHAVGYSIYPFMTASVIKYIADYGIKLPVWQLALSVILFVVGFVFFYGSNRQKDLFRKNPFDPAFSHWETIPTNKGKKLLVCSYWGIVRHPNYLGDILINLSFMPYVLTAPPLITLVGVIILLVHRSVRDNARCKQKYGSAWDRYCNRVKYVLIPKVY